MRTRRPLGRRRFLLLSGGAAAIAIGVGASSWACRLSERERTALESAHRLFAVIDEIVAPDALGTAWSRSHEPREILRQLARKEGLVADGAIRCEASRRAALRKRLREDFIAGDVLVVDRWVVSRSECVLAGLWASRRPSRRGA